MAHILFLTQVLPYPLDAGPKIRAYYVLRQLAQQHQITLVSFVRDDDQAKYLTPLKEFCHAVHVVPIRRSLARNAWAMLRALVTGDPIIILRDDVREMRTKLNQLVTAQSFDVIHADQTSMAQYALYARSLIPAQQTSMVLDAHNAFYRIFTQLAKNERRPLHRLFLSREARAFARYEPQLYQHFDHTVFVTAQDRRALKILSSDKDRKYTIIPICLDLDDRPLISTQPSSKTITHLGTMFWPPNVEGVLWFAKEVFPRVLAQIPTAQFVIIGKNPPLEIRNLAHQISNIRVTGYVSDPLPYLAKTAAFIVPLHSGAGMRVKILDAWCWGLPIITTSLGIEGIELPEEETAAQVADTPEEFAQAIVQILSNPQSQARMRRVGRHWVNSHYNWRQIYKRWDHVYKQLLP